MSENEQYNKDQAELLRRQVLETQGDNSDAENKEKNLPLEHGELSRHSRRLRQLSEETTTLEKVLYHDLDDESVESERKLPPRRKTHANRKKKVKLQFKYPLVRLLTIVFLLLVLLVPGYSIWKDRNVVIQNKSEPVASLEESIEIERTPAAKEDSSPEPQTDDERLSMKDESSYQEVQPPPLQKDEETKPNEPESTPEVVAEKTSQTNGGKTEKSYLVHTVQDGETLFRISMKYYKSRAGESKIKEANNLQSDGSVYVGQRLKIPLN